MKNNNLDSALALALKLEHVLIATADAAGMPHVAAAVQMSRASENELAVSGWFCPGTMANLEYNRSIALVVWDPPSDTGYQILGTVQNIEEMAMMNGYSPGDETASPMPQVENNLRIHVDKIIAFSHAPHTDMEA